MLIKKKLSANKNYHEIYNICTGDSQSIEKVYNLVIKNLKSRSKKKKVVWYYEYNNKKDFHEKVLNSNLLIYLMNTHALLKIFIKKGLKNLVLNPH